MSFKLGYLPRNISYGSDGFPDTIANYYRAYCKLLSIKADERRWEKHLLEILIEHGGSVPHNSYTLVGIPEYKRIYTVIKRNSIINSL